MSRFGFLFLFSLLLFASASPHNLATQRPRKAAQPHPSGTPVLDHPSASPLAASWSIDVSKPLVHVSPDLYGIFFEEINHSGTGGLWNQQIMNVRHIPRTQYPPPSPPPPLFLVGV